LVGYIVKIHKVTVTTLFQFVKIVCLIISSTDTDVGGDIDD